MWTTSYILSQVFSACAYIIFPLTFLTRNKKNILLLNILNSVFYLLSYLFLAGYSGVIVVATITLSIVFYRSWMIFCL